jgi:hypothetical protein
VTAVDIFADWPQLSPYPAEAQRGGGLCNISVIARLSSIDHRDLDGIDAEAMPKGDVDGCP